MCSIACIAIERFAFVAILARRDRVLAPSRPPDVCLDRTVRSAGVLYICSLCRGRVGSAGVNLCVCVTLHRIGQTAEHT